MPLVFSCILVIMALASPARADEPIDADSPLRAPTKDEVDKARRAEMASLIAAGDQARRAGRTVEAANAYSKALQLGDNPLIGGRLGVLLVQHDNPVLGADYLLDAIDRADNAPPWERQAFLNAYDKAKKKVCRVSIEISQAHAQILLDGVVTQEDGVSSFTMFVNPGDHELRAKLEGHEDAVVNFLAPKGASMQVTLELKAIVKPAEVVETPAYRVPHIKATPEQVLKALNSGTTQWGIDPANTETLYDQPTPVAEEPKGTRFSVTGGIVTVFGVASWSPAVGGVIGVGLRPHEYVSFGLEGRAAWLTTGVADRKISAMTAAGLLSGCGHLGWFFGCGLVHLGGVNIVFDDASYDAASSTQFKFGAGGRLGVRGKLGNVFVLQGAVDALALQRGTQIVVGRMVVAEQPPVMVGAEILGGLEF